MLREVSARGAHPDTVLLSPNASPNPKAADSSLAAGDAAHDDGDELSLVDLLLQASETIREERARADALENENTVLRAQLDCVRAAYHRTAAQRHTSSNPAATDELFTYVERHLVAANGEKATAAPLRAASGSSSEPPQRQRSTSTTTGTTTTTRASSSSAARAASRGSVTAATQSYRRGWEAVAATATVGKAAAMPSPRCVHQDPAEHVATTASSTAAVCPLERSKANEGERDDTADGLRCDGETASCSPTAQAMACRLRRALAPRPAGAVVGDIIHTMVTALQKDVQAKLTDQYASAPLRRLRGFAMVRLRPCVYRLLYGVPAEVKAAARSPSTAGSASLRRSLSPPSATPYRHHYLLYHTTHESPQAASPSNLHAVVVHLTIDSGTLRVMRGGGHVNFVEYLERLLHVQITNG
jgi:hypothetical protein